MPRWTARRPLLVLDPPAPEPPAQLDARLDLAVRAAEIRYRSEATELVLRDRFAPEWRRDLRGWLDPITRLAERV